MSQRIPEEEKIAAAKTRVFKIITRRFGERGLLEYLQLSDLERVNWENANLPGVNTKEMRPKKETPFNLTAREIEICELFGQGCSCAEIAEQLYIVEGTVSDHLQNVRIKVGASTVRKAMAKIGKWEMLE